MIRIPRPHLFRKLSNSNVLKAIINLNLLLTIALQKKHKSSYNDDTFLFFNKIYNINLIHIMMNTLTYYTNTNTLPIHLPAN